MKKYLYITKMVILENLQYVFSKLGGLFMYLLFMYIFLQLWQYMYTEQTTISGYTLNQMVWYCAITEILWSCIRPKNLKDELSSDIRSGKIAYLINKPFSYIEYLVSKYIGEMIVSLSLYLTLGIFVSFLLLGGLETFTLISLPFILITTVLSSLITVYLYISISLFSFWFEEVTPFFWIYEKLILVIGVIFPIEIFPSYLQPIIKLSPIYTTMYAPAKMVVDFSFNSFIDIFIIQIFYLIIVFFISKFIYRRGVKRLNVNGG